VCGLLCSEIWTGYKSIVVAKHGTGVGTAEKERPTFGPISSSLCKSGGYEMVAVVVLI
jgi:hypothetical protein